MGRKQLPTEVLQPLLKFAIESGEFGITRKTAIKKGVISNSRWALIKNRAVEEGLLVRIGWKKSARYYIPEFAPKIYDEESGEALPEEEDLSLEIEELEQTQEETKHEETRIRVALRANLGLKHKEAPTALDEETDTPAMGIHSIRKWEVQELHNGAAESCSPPPDDDNTAQQLSEIDAVNEDRKVVNAFKTAEQFNDTPKLGNEVDAEEEDWDFDFA